VTTLEEVTAWSLEDIRAGIAARLPKGWTLEEKVHPGGTIRARICRLSPEGTSVAEWQDMHVDPKILLLGAFGFLWLRECRPDPTSPWARHSNPTREAMNRRVNAIRCTVPDPPDVDPREVQAVYEAAKKKPAT
jgi:hypothetical protein